MRVIENNDFIEVTCPHCKSKLAVHCEDIIDNDVGPLTIKCGVCGRTIETNAGQIPNHWKSIIFKD